MVMTAGQDKSEKVEEKSSGTSRVGAGIGAGVAGLLIIVVLAIVIWKTRKLGDDREVEADHSIQFDESSIEFESTDPREYCDVDRDSGSMADSTSVE